jgi:hypothetical protein
LKIIRPGHEHDQDDGLVEPMPNSGWQPVAVDNAAFTDRFAIEIRYFMTSLSWAASNSEGVPPPGQKKTLNASTQRARRGAESQCGITPVCGITFFITSWTIM